MSGPTHQGGAAEEGRAGLGVAITAYELCSGLGGGRGATEAALRAGRHGLTAAGDTDLDPLPFSTVVGTATGGTAAGNSATGRGDFAPLPSHLRRFDTGLTRMAAWLAEGVAEAVESAKKRWGAERIGLYVGTSTAGIAETEAAYARVHSGDGLPSGYSFHDQHAYHGLLTVLRDRTGVAGPGHVISTACSSSGKVFASAWRAMAAGRIDAALVGGVDALCQTTLRGFYALGALSTAACRPFSAERAGINIGEGGALLLLERATWGGSGGAAPRLRLVGFGESSDAYHMSAPHPEGRGAYEAMAAALAMAGVAPEAVDLINAHGTATPLNDAMESLAIARLFGEAGPPVVATKAYTGHLLGAAGAVEAALTAVSLEAQLTPPALRLAPQDPACPVRLATAADSGAPLRLALSSSFAFGGNNVCVALASGPRRGATTAVGAAPS